MSNENRAKQGASLIALAIVTVSTQAEARTHLKAHKHAVVRSHADSGAIAELKAQISALQTRLDAQEAAQHVTADQAAAAATSAQAAQAQSAQISAQVASNSAAVAAQVKSAISANAPKANWAADTKVTGLVFFNASNINQQRYTAAGVATKTVPSGTGFDIKRLYIGVEHNFDKTFSAVAVIDANASGAYSGNANLNGAIFTSKTPIFRPNSASR